MPTLRSRDDCALQHQHHGCGGTHPVRDVRGCGEATVIFGYPIEMSYMSETESPTQAPTVPTEQYLAVLRELDRYRQALEQIAHEDLSVARPPRRVLRDIAREALE